MIYGYGRVSTDEQSMSLEIQQRAIERWVEMNDHHADYKGFVYDEAVSGAMEWHKRPVGSVLNAILGRGDMIVAAAFDRLFRSTLDSIQRIRAWMNAGVEMVTIDMKIDTSSPVGRFIATTVAGIKEMERETIRSRVTNGVEWRASLCPVLQPPTGWMAVDRNLYEPDHERRAEIAEFATKVVSSMRRMGGRAAWWQTAQSRTSNPIGLCSRPVSWDEAARLVMCHGLGFPLIGYKDARRLWRVGSDMSRQPTINDILGVIDRRGALDPTPEHVTETHLRAMEDVRSMRGGKGRRKTTTC